MDLVVGKHSLSIFEALLKIIKPFFKKLQRRKPSLYSQIGSLTVLAASSDDEGKDFDILRHLKHEILIKYLIIKFDHTFIFINMNCGKDSSLIKIESPQHTFYWLANSTSWLLKIRPEAGFNQDHNFCHIIQQNMA